MKWAAFASSRLDVTTGSLPQSRPMRIDGILRDNEIVWLNDSEGNLNLIAFQISVFLLFFS